MMMLKVIHHLAEVVREPVKVDVLRDGTPSEVEVRLLVVGHLGPQVRACLLHDAFDECCIVPVQDLVLEHAASLRLWQELVLNAARADRGSHLQLRHSLHYQLVLGCLLHTSVQELWSNDFHALASNRRSNYVLSLICVRFGCFVIRGICSASNCTDGCATSL